MAALMIQDVMSFSDAFEAWHGIFFEVAAESGVDISGVEVVAFGEAWDADAFAAGGFESGEHDFSQFAVGLAEAVGGHIALEGLELPVEFADVCGEFDAGFFGGEDGF